MAESMTGYGRAENVIDSRKYLIEVKSINNRYCDVQVRMPRMLLSLEPQIRQRVTAVLMRGKADVYVTLDDQTASKERVVADLDLARGYSEALFQIAAATGRQDTVGADFIAGLPEVLLTQAVGWSPEVVEQGLFITLDAALAQLSQMRKLEGSKLAQDILQKLDGLSAMREQLVLRAPLVTVEYRTRLQARMEELLGSDSNLIFDVGRREAEVAIYADKCAIDEELVRLESHLHQFCLALAAEGSIGKKMDFILQEINREINTIGSKANDIETTNLVLAMKTDLEKIREQVQNLA